MRPPRLHFKGSPLGKFLLDGTVLKDCWLLLRAVAGSKDGMALTVSVF